MVGEVKTYLSKTETKVTDGVLESPEILNELGLMPTVRSARLQPTGKIEIKVTSKVDVSKLIKLVDKEVKVIRIDP